jgi:hypothetical protein
MGGWGVKTTVEIPDPVFRRTKSKAAERGQTLREFVTEALQDKLSRRAGASALARPGWMRGFGALRKLRKETARVQAEIDHAFGVVEPEDRL